MKYEKDLVSRGICWSCNPSQCLTSSLQIRWTIISTVSQIKRSRQSKNARKMTRRRGGTRKS